LDVVPSTAERAFPPSKDPPEARNPSDGPSETMLGSKTMPAGRAREVSAASPLASQAAPGEAPSTTESSWSFDPIRRTSSDLGIGSHWRSVVAEGAAGAQSGTRSAPPPSAPGETVRDRSRAIDRSMRDMLTARDVSLGIGRAGPLVSAAHEAASTSSAPEVGATILEVECDSRGTVVAARAEYRSWNDVAGAVVRRMAGKTLRVPHGARGLRARLRVVAEKALPSGSHGSSSFGAVPDDIPGGNQACDGNGIHRRCVAGMPVGGTTAEHDTSNVGSKPTRIVHVQLLGETEL
jgi:hypothetical protein